MDTYGILRAFADSWFLIAMFAFFVGAALFAFRPGSKNVHDDIANIPFRHEDKPAGDPDMTGRSAQKELRQ